MTDKLDLLNDSIDQLNAGHNPRVDDPETADLLEVATLLRESGLPVTPPDHVLTATRQAAADGLAASRLRRRMTWMYSGLAGAAAALLIFVGLHGFTPVQEVASTVALPSTPLPTPAGKSADAGSPSSLPASAAPQPKTTAIPSQSPTPAESPASPTQPPPATKSTPAAAPRQSVPASQARLYKAAPVSSDRQVAPSRITTLIWPGRVPDSVTSDPVTGVIRQVFAVGTTQEVVITQRKTPVDESAPAANSEQSAGGTKSAEKKAAVRPHNKLVEFWNGQQITVEGPQPLADLAAILQQLKAANPSTPTP
jgi:hypothetical protein